MSRIGEEGLVSERNLDVSDKVIEGQCTNQNGRKKYDNGGKLKDREMTYLVPRHLLNLNGVSPWTLFGALLRV